MKLNISPNLEGQIVEKFKSAFRDCHKFAQSYFDDDSRFPSFSTIDTVSYDPTLENRNLTKNQSLNKKSMQQIYQDRDSNRMRNLYSKNTPIIGINNQINHYNQNDNMIQNDPHLMYKQYHLLNKNSIPFRNNIDKSPQYQFSDKSQLNYHHNSNNFHRNNNNNDVCLHNLYQPNISNRMTTTNTDSFDTELNCSFINPIDLNSIFDSCCNNFQDKSHENIDTDHYLAIPPTPKET